MSHLYSFQIAKSRLSRSNYLMRFVILIGLAVSADVHAGVVSFVDSTFNLADYSQLAFSTDPSLSITNSQTALGNPGTALQISFQNAGAAVNLLSTQGLINNAFSYDPSTQGAITGIDFANDKFVDMGANINPLPGFFTNSRPLIRQNGNFYFATIPDVQVRQTWTTTSGLLLQNSDFSLFDFATGSASSAHPDFSSSGTIIEFGLANRFNLGTVGVPIDLNGFFRYDNLSIAVHNANDVSEPSTFALFGFLLLGVPLYRRASRMSPQYSLGHFREMK